jgi:two-component system OmpR family response regulator
MKKEKLIFVVDDDPFINTLVSRNFASEEYRIESFESGEDCLNAISKNPDLVILDYLFVDTNNHKALNGMEILDMIKSARPDLPVIMLSGQEKGEVVLELARKGIDDYVIKDKDLIGNLHNSVKDLIGKR